MILLAIVVGAFCLIYLVVVLAMWNRREEKAERERQPPRRPNRHLDNRP